MVSTDIEIKKLCPELIEDYLHFFDVTPHSERPDSEDCKCYCVWWCQNDQSGDIFDRYLSSKEKRREYARESILHNQIQGYLAYFDDEVVGWCNANTKSLCEKCFCWQSFMKNVKADREKVKSIFCFAVSPSMWGKGIATLLLRRVIDDAKKDGFTVVESYPKKNFLNQAEDFMGPIRMYEKEGFIKSYEIEDKAVMRKVLKII